MSVRLLAFPTSIAVLLALSVVACTRTPQTSTERAVPFTAASDTRATVTPQLTEAESSRHAAGTLESSPAESPSSVEVHKEVVALFQEWRDLPGPADWPGCLLCKVPRSRKVARTPEDVRLLEIYDRLHALGDPAVPAFARMLQSSLQGSDRDLTRTILGILGGVSHPGPSRDGIEQKTDISAALPVLILALDDSDPATRMLAGNLIGNIGQKAAEAVPKLVALLSDENMAVRTGVCNGLSGIDPLPALRQALSDPSPDKRQFAQRAIASIETKCLGRQTESGPLEVLARTADLICKATVIADRGVTDDSFKPIDGFEVREAELRVVSTLKGEPPNVIRFRYYDLRQDPQDSLDRAFITLLRLIHVAEAERAEDVRKPVVERYTFATGRTYIVLAKQIAGGIYRELPDAHAFAIHHHAGFVNGAHVFAIHHGAVRLHRFGDEGVLLAADAKPHRGTTLTEAEWAELLGLLKSPDKGDVEYAIRALDELSREPNPSFERDEALLAIQPLVGAENGQVATAAITVLGRDSPYFNDGDVPFWLAGINKGRILGLGPRKRLANPVVADIGAKELLQVATDGRTPELRALAIRALGRRSQAYPMVAVWARDPSGEVRRAAVLASGDLPNREPIMTASTGGSPELRRMAAYAVGFAQDPRLLSILDKLLQDPIADVRSAAALGLLSYPVDQAAPVMKANLTSDFRPLFVNALASADPQPYLPMLAEIIEQGQDKERPDQMEPVNWHYGGMIPAADSWQILFDFIKSRPTDQLTSGTLDSSLNALERMHWYNAGQPSEVYELYVSDGLVSRAKQFREKSFPFDMKEAFDRIDQNHRATD